MNLFDIRGKVAIVTGGSKGIGKGIALAFAEAGADVAVVSSQPLPEIVGEIEHFGVRCRTYAYDFRDCTGLEDLVSRIAADFGTIDILVNNAGAQRRHPCAEFPQDDWDYIMNVNAKSVFFLCQAVGRLMIAKVMARSSTLLRWLLFKAD
jgi:2-dehydro-3-deoxy-D-gluconate 5-dehydrogenase